MSGGEQVATHELTLPIVVNMVIADEAKTAGTDQEVVEEVLILKAARAQDEARKLADEGPFRNRGRRAKSGAGSQRRMAPTRGRG